MHPVSASLAKVLILAFAKDGVGAQGSTLEDYLPKLGWDSAKNGALIVVDPSHTPAVADGSNLGSFNRKIASFSTVSGIVPTEMVVITDDLPEANLYDGLDNDSKVLYLLATMSKEQLRLASGKGVSQADLSGQQRAALKSLISEPFSYSESRIPGPNNLSESVAADKLGEICLKINRHITFEVSPTSDPNALMRFGERQMGGTPGLSHLWHLATSNHALYGLTSKALKPNVTKPSDLVYGAPSLSAQIPLLEKTTIADLVLQASKISGLSIYADPRTASLPVVAFGTSARVGDLLKALANAVTGTFRKVGRSYVLTSDLMGLGQRQMRYWVWEGRSGEKKGGVRSDYLKQIFASKALDLIGYDASDPLRPDEGIAAKIAASEGGTDTLKVDSSELSISEKAAIDRISQTISRTQTFDSSKIGVISELSYCFVLPDGRKLNSELCSLGPIKSWKDGIDSPGNAPPAIGRLSIGKPAGPRALLLKLDDSAMIKSVSQAASALGFTELWIETFSPAVLSAAVKSELKVRLVADPWKATKPLSDPDRDEIGGLAGLESLAVEDSAGIAETISPLDTNLPARWSALKALASTPQVAGFVIGDTQPKGYERDRPPKRPFFGGPTERLEFGYSTAEREAFLKQYGIDPIDIYNDVHISFDIAQPFFPNSNALMKKLSADWNGFRFDLNSEKTQKLLDFFGNPANPPLIQVRRRMTVAEGDQYSFTALTPEKTLSSLYDKATGDTQVMNLPLEDPPGFSPNPTAPPITACPDVKSTLAFDLRLVEPKNLLQFLDHWFVRPKP